MATATRPQASLSRQYNKLCDLPDFADPGLRAMLRDIAPGHEPETELRRKFWEYAMLGLYLEEAGVLHDATEVLAVAAGHEEPLFWLANRVGRVLATDIYGEGGFAYREADDSMLTNPSGFAPYPYRESHLEVRAMDALDLDLPDASFDVVYSLSSIEHFGEPAQIRKAASEMGRVLRPGGHLVVVTECLVGHQLIDAPLVQYGIRLATFGRRCRAASPRKRVIDAFTAKELRRDVVVPSGCEPVQPLDETISASTWENIIHWEGAGTLTPATGRAYPHILLKAHGSPWTSAFLALRKPGP